MWFSFVLSFKIEFPISVLILNLFILRVLNEFECYPAGSEENRNWSPRIGAEDEIGCDVTYCTVAVRVQSGPDLDAWRPWTKQRKNIFIINIRREVVYSCLLVVDYFSKSVVEAPGL